MMGVGTVLEIVKILLPTLVAAGFGLILLRRLEEVKSEVARLSDFNRKWAELFFEASNTSMVSVERLLALVSVFATQPNPNDEPGLEQQRQVNDLIPALVEHRFRIRRLAALAVTGGPTATAASDRVFEIVANATRTKVFDPVVILREIDNFNLAARKAHSEIIACQTPK